MKIILLSDESIRLERAEGPLTIEAESFEQAYSPYHMMAGALASCTHSVLDSWATHARLDASGLAIEISWSFVEQPLRVGELVMTIIWPELPAERRTAAVKAAAHCPVHATLSHPPAIRIEEPA
ncbi:MAG TPA: OsmC family protein [Thermoanaerobaculia bacterium]|nr:OsmC family protein [Thermoanaerobaculia bacterium]